MSKKKKEDKKGIEELAKKEAKKISVNFAYKGKLQCEKCGENEFKIIDFKSNKNGDSIIFNYFCTNEDCYHKFDVIKKIEDM